MQILLLRIQMFCYVIQIPFYPLRIHIRIFFWVSKLDILIKIKIPIMFRMIIIFIKAITTTIIIITIINVQINFIIINPYLINFFQSYKKMFYLKYFKGFI
jgi:hypothetical protein